VSSQALPEVTAPATAVILSVVEYARLAPSVHNTQPWWWRLTGNCLELYADHDRQLVLGDPSGRNLVISCGAALHHAQVAAHALGRPGTVELLPEGAAPAPLARLHPAAYAPSDTADADLRALRERRTDRRRFTAWPVPGERVEALARHAREQGAHATVLLEVSDRFKVDLLISRARAVQSRDDELARELHQWIDRGGPDGVVSTALPERPDGRTRFPAGELTDPARDVGGTDQLIVLGGLGDDVASWLRTGQGLSALWLRATTGGLSVVPCSEVVEVTETRVVLEHEVLGGREVPHILVRVGWQAIGRSELPRSPRRTVDQVLRR
jgi:hypothetical protein